MRRTKEATVESRGRIVEEASRLFRERGIDGVTVAEVMEAAGLTHGGFYRHFPSKEALVAEALGSALRQRADALAPTPTRDTAQALSDYVVDYLSAGHVTHPARGCMLAAVGSDVAHAGARVQQSAADGAAALIERLGQSLEHTRSEPRSDAIVLLSTLVGAVILARAVGDTPLRHEVLRAAAESELVQSALSK
jgi:TetR/AcrR family transcriptional repressor of nem operon